MFQIICFTSTLFTIYMWHTSSFLVMNCTSFYHSILLPLYFHLSVYNISNATIYSTICSKSLTKSNSMIYSLVIRIEAQIFE